MNIRTPIRLTAVAIWKQIPLSMKLSTNLVNILTKLVDNWNVFYMECEADRLVVWNILHTIQTGASVPFSLVVGIMRYKILY